MQKRIVVCFVALLFFVSCNPTGNTVNLTDPVEAGREFIDASLKGNYAKAKKYVLADSINMEYFNRYESFNKNLSSNEKDGYKNANIIIDSIQNISDSVTIINYSNTFKRSPGKVKLLKIDKEWLVDFKFTFLGNSDYGNK
ncbi:MAG: hypothetical protein ABIO55_18335 [Ginsengibacter sp.]